MTVLKTTCGTVTVCVIVEPDVMVWVKVMTVDGILPVNGGAVGNGRLLHPVGSTEPVGGGVGVGAAGVGTRVIVEGTPVQIPGFCGTNFAQIPTR